MMVIHLCMYQILPSILLYASGNRNDDHNNKSADGAILKSVCNCYTTSSAGSNVPSITYFDIIELNIQQRR